MGAVAGSHGWAVGQAGTIRELYFRADESSAVLMLECKDAGAAWKALSSLPLVAAGLIEFEVLPLRAYPGFGRLFADGQPGSPAASSERG